MTSPAIFRHHPEAAVDFCCEVEMLEGWAYELKVGIRKDWMSFWGHLARALRYARKYAADLATDECAPRAIEIARGLEARATGLTALNSESRT